MQPERMLAELDKEIETARRRVDQLTAARAQYAAAHGLGRRAISSEGTGRDGEPAGSNGRTPRGGLMATLFRVMAHGEFRHLDDILAAAQRDGCGTTRRSVMKALSQNSGDGDPFERGRRGMYRVRPAVLAQWATSGAAAA